MVTSKINLLAVIVALVAVTGTVSGTFPPGSGPGLQAVPDAASTVGLFSIALAGLAVGRQLLRK